MAREKIGRSEGWPGESAGWRKATLLAPVAGGAFAADVLTKTLVERHFHLYEQVPVVGDYLRLTLLYNPGAAFGISLGEYSRAGFLVLTVVALIALVAMYMTTPLRDRARLFALSLVVGGALGNLWNRIVSPRGVTDWIDVGLGDLRWPIFNLADIAITIGAVFLALSLWREDARERPHDAQEREAPSQAG
jgi:signal peptidase II